VRLAVSKGGITPTVQLLLPIESQLATLTPTELTFRSPVLIGCCAYRLATLRLLCHLISDIPDYSGTQPSLRHAREVVS